MKCLRLVQGKDIIALVHNQQHLVQKMNVKNVKTQEAERRKWVCMTGLPERLMIYQILK